MEGVPKSETINNHEKLDSVEVAQGLYEKLKVYDDADVVGNEALSKIESLAQALTEELQNIPVAVRQQAGLPWHPYEAATATNDDTYRIAA